MSGVKGRTGRKARTVETRELRKTLAATAKQGVRLLFNYLKGKDEHGNKVKPLSYTKLEAIKLAIAHTIGTPRQSVELKHTGDQLTLKELAMLAQSGDETLVTLEQEGSKTPTVELTKTPKRSKN